MGRREPFEGGAVKATAPIGAGERAGTAEPTSDVAIAVRSVVHRYGDVVALAGLDFDVARGSLHGLLGPNGGGKTTLMRILSTLLVASEGGARVCGLDVAVDRDAVRRRIGVVFQNASLDGRLTVRENLECQATLYGLGRSDRGRRIDELLAAFALADRADARVDALSGGLRRRTDLARGLLHAPDVLLLDEPSSGLDPSARVDLWSLVADIRRRYGTTVLVATHLMDEAERCDQLGILDRGQLVASGTPDDLKAEVGGDVISVRCADPESMLARLHERFGPIAQLVDGTLRIERADGHRFIPELVESFPGAFEEVSLGRPTLEEVFVRRTGHAFRSDETVGES